MRCRRALWLLFAAPLLAHAAYVPDDLTFDTLGSAAGLPNQNVTAIVQDAQGYLWFGTAAGLVRYDGDQFRTYANDPADASTVSDSYIRTLSVDRDGELWVGTLLGLDRYVRASDSWQHYRLDDAHTPPHTRRMVWQILPQPACRGAERVLWIATSDGLKRLALDSGAVTTFRHDAQDPGSPAADRVYALASDAQCRMWIGTAQGVQYLARDSTRFVAFPPAADVPAGASARVEALLVDSRQTLWIGMTGERSAWDVSAADLAHAQRWFRQATDAAAQHLIEDHRHRIWAATGQQGLQLWDREQGVARAYRPYPGDAHASPSLILNWVYEGRDQTLWLGTFDRGAVHADLGTAGFLRYRHRDDDPASLGSDHAGTVQGDADGAALWIGSLSGLERLDLRSGQATTFRHDAADPRSLANDTVDGIALDPAGTVWIATEAGIDAFERATRTFRHLPLSAPISSINTLACDAAGQLWVGTNSGVVRVDTASGKATPVALDTTPGLMMRVIAFYFDGPALWIATETGLIRYDLAAQKPTLFQHQEGVPGTLSNSHVTGVMRDRAGRLWVSTSRGLNRLDLQADGSARFRAYTRRDGLLSDGVGRAVEDRAGQLWLPTLVGLTRLDPASGAVSNFTVRDGLIEDGYMVDAAYAAPDGWLYFGGFNGLTAFQPEAIETNTTVPAAAINALDVLDRRRAQPEHFAPPRALDLPYTTAVVTFDVAALHFADTSRNRLRYRLDDFDGAWRERDASQHTVTYTNLSAGEYTFRLQAASKNGVWSEPVALALRIQPPFWDTLWFRLLALALLAAALTAAYRLRIAGLKARQRELEGEVAARTAELRQASEHKSAFLATMSHEIRTPMNAVVGLVHLSLRERGLGERVRSYLGKIHLSAAALLRIIDDILDTSKIEAGRLDIERVGFRLDDLVSHVRTVTEQKAAERGLALSFEIAPECPRELVGDPLRLGQVLINLINNAIKFTEQGAVRARCEVERADDDSVWLRWSVRDSGIGMTPEQLAKLFRPFVQADASITRKYGGTGLGLSISRRLVELMGGQLHADSAVGVGTTFAWTLRFERARPGDVFGSADAAPTPARAYAAATVLLVEDNAINQLIAAELMTGAGLAVDVADSGEAAVRRVGENPGGHYAVLLMDLQMPGMDGFAATRALRALPAGRDVPIVALTAHASAEIQQRCRDAGMQGCLSKPFHPAQLFALLDRFVAAAPLSAPRDAAPDAAATDAAAMHADAALPPLFDAERGLACVDRNAALFATVLRRFDAQTPATLNELERALRSGDHVLANRTAHTLRGLAGTIGALRLADAAARLELSLQAAEPDEAAARHLAGAVEGLVPATLAEIARYLASAPAAPSTPAAPLALPAQRGEYFATLRRLLEGGSGRTPAWVAQGREHLLAELGPERAQAFERAVAAFDFAAALRVLQQADVS